MAGKQWWINALAALLAALPTALAGPRDFGLREVDKAIAARGVKPQLVRFSTELTLTGKPESYRILPGRIAATDLRGLMYGLLEAADQIRTKGRLLPAKGEPAVAMRGIRVFLHNEALERSWYYSREYWVDFIEMLARNRFNRFNLVFAHQTSYLAPPYPFWVDVPEFPGVRVPGLSPADRARNLDMLRFIAQTAADHAVDFTLGIWEHDIQPGMKASVEGLTPENIGPYSKAALSRILEECTGIRAVQMRTNAESGIPRERQVEFYRDWVFPAIASAGRRVTLEVRGWLMSPGLMDAALHGGAPLRLSSKYWSEDVGRPYQPAETFPNYSFLNFLEKPRAYDFYWELWGLGSHRLMLWGDPDFVRRAVGTFTLGGSIGFEIDPPLAQKGFGNRPGEWGVFTAAAQDRVFWKHEFERYWLFYRLWGRLSYDSQAGDRTWMEEMERRFGGAAGDVMAAYRAASPVLGEVVAAHLADPNMYLWPEINPGGLIDAYREVRSSDWRFIANPVEAVRDRLAGRASAKQTPLETAEKLHSLALSTEQALARARSAAAAGPEWRSTESDFQVLAALARYHGRKQMAAWQLEWFYRTGDDSGLHAARRELTGAERVWRQIVKLTDGVYPDTMAFGPDDVGHWKDKLAYVEHDRKVLDWRLEVYERYGRFAAGFDFGAPVAIARGASYRNDPFVLGNTVEPRFSAVDPATAFDAARGYGWATEGERQAAAVAATPYHEVRAVAREPKQLHTDVLFGDAIHGRGAQVFRVALAPGDYAVTLIGPDRTGRELSLTARDGVLDIPMPDGDWTVSGLIVKAAVPQPLPSVTLWTGRVPKPALEHKPLKTALPDQPLPLAIRVWPIKDATTVRLHYRALNQLAAWKTIETSAAKPALVIPAADISERWDLQYYFEVLNREGGGWFLPDPSVATPYYVVTVAKPPASPGGGPGR